MWINELTVIKGRRVVLVPYNEEHVVKYNEWMQSSELQELTASEPLSLDQEFAMQKTWRLDQNKCTFIMLSGELYEKTFSETESMIGDVNLFVSEEDGESVAEVEIMIAEKSFRGVGLGSEAIVLLLNYAVQRLNIKRFRAKIGLKNESSLLLFRKIGFQEVSVSKVFNEITLERTFTASQIEQLFTERNFLFDMNERPAK